MHHFGGLIWCFSESEIGFIAAPPVFCGFRNVTIYNFYTFIPTSPFLFYEFFLSKYFTVKTVYLCSLTVK